MNRHVSRSLLFLLTASAVCIFLAGCLPTAAPATQATATYDPFPVTATVPAQPTVPPTATIPPTAFPTLTPVPILPAPTAAPGAAKVLVGLSFIDRSIEPWKSESAALETLLKAQGYEVAIQDALGETDTQPGQIDGLTAMGAKAILIAAKDGGNTSGAAERAAAKGIQVIAYDRFVYTASLAAFITFDAVEAGRRQAEGVLKALGIDAWDVNAKGKVRLVKLGGSSFDLTAILLRKGQDEVISRYQDKIEVVAERWVNDPAQAGQMMGEILGAQNDRIHGVVASDDATALGALQVLREHKLAGVVAISGLGASAEACNSLAKGELTLTILEDRRALPARAVSLLNQILSGQTNSDLKPQAVADLSNQPGLAGEVKVLTLPLQAVTRDNLYPTVVQTFYQPFDAVYQGIPEVNRPPKP